MSCHWILSIPLWAGNYFPCVIYEGTEVLRGEVSWLWPPSLEGIRWNKKRGLLVPGHSQPCPLHCRDHSPHPLSFAFKEFLYNQSRHHADSSLPCEWTSISSACTPSLPSVHVLMQTWGSRLQERQQGVPRSKSTGRKKESALCYNVCGTGVPGIARPLNSSQPRPWDGTCVHELKTESLNARALQSN